MSGIFRTKWPGVVRGRQLEKSYSLFDLVCVGVGGTIGSGVFVLTGLITRENGPAAPLCYLVGGIGCIFSAASYAELSAKIPSTGSGYAYVMATLGEYPAIVAAGCLSLEYGGSAAAVARSWGDKLSSGLYNSMGIPKSTSQPFDLNIGASLLQLACVLLLLRGVDISKKTVNVLTVAKLVLCVIMITGGLCLLQPRLFSQVQFQSVSVNNVLRGSTTSFFAFLGYDEVCFLSSESKNPRNLSIAVFLTLAISTVVYVLAALALAGMSPRELINSESGFSSAFLAHGGGWEGFAHFVALGELLTLPLVVLITFMAQPRLQLALAQDGLLPEALGILDDRGNMRNGILCSGVVCVLLALLVPFRFLEDVISAAVLISFQMTNAALMVLRKAGAGSNEDDVSVARGGGGSSSSSRVAFNPLQQHSSHSSHSSSTDSAHLPETIASVSESQHGLSDGDSESKGNGEGGHDLPDGMIHVETEQSHLGSIHDPGLHQNSSQPNRLVALLLCFHCAAILFATCVSHPASQPTLSAVMAVLSAVACMWLARGIDTLPDSPPRPDSASTDSHLSLASGAPYQVPFVPYTPLIGTVINYLLLAQLSASSAFFLVLFFLAITLLYLGTRQWRGSWWGSIEELLNALDRAVDPPQADPPAAATHGAEIAASGARSYSPLEVAGADTRRRL